MPTLHLVNKAASHDALSRCLSVASAGDEVLLIEDGVYCALSATLTRFVTGHVRMRALRVDVDARGLRGKLSDGVLLTEDAEFVELVVRHQPIVSWA